MPWHSGRHLRHESITLAHAYQCILPHLIMTGEHHIPPRGLLYCKLLPGIHLLLKPLFSMLSPQPAQPKSTPYTCLPIHQCDGRPTPLAMGVHPAFTHEGAPSLSTQHDKVPPSPSTAARECVPVIRPALSHRDDSHPPPRASQHRAAPSLPAMPTSMPRMCLLPTSRSTTRCDGCQPALHRTNLPASTAPHRLLSNQQPLTAGHAPPC